MHTQPAIAKRESAHAGFRRIRLNLKRFTPIIFLLLSIPVIAQISVGGEPYSLRNGLEKSIQTMITGEVDRLALLAEDQQSLKQGLPLRFGQDFEVRMNLDNSGTWQVLPGEGMLWRLRLECPGAYSINLIFNRYNLPEGARLFIYDEDYQSVLGAFTANNNKAHGGLATAPTRGDVCIVEYFEPENVPWSGELEIGKIIHGYRDIFFPANKTGEKASGACNINVNCPQGDAWSDEIRSVVRIIVNGSALCSGALVNNSIQDQTPYLLTANHCFNAAPAVANWVVQFNYQSPTCNNGPGPQGDTVSGTVLRARNSASDVCLVELSENPPADYNVFFAGWDRRNIAAQASTAIHHPSGDIKKISFDYDPLTSTQYLQEDVDADHTHWRVGNWEEGTTEGGSSGSPLFDQNHRVVGQLHGGYASCTSDTSDWYGKFSVSWDAGDNSSDRLLDWLDPSSSGIQFLNGISGTQVNFPEVDITDPAPGSALAGTVTIRADATDDKSVQQVDFYIDQDFLGSDSFEPYQMLWDTTTLQDGDYNITVIATNNEGRKGNDTIPVVVLNAFLQVTIDISRTSGIAPMSIQFTAVVSGGEPPYSYEWRFGEMEAGSQLASDSYEYSLSGEYEWNVTVRDSSSQTFSDNGTILVRLPSGDFGTTRTVAHFTNSTDWISRITAVNRETREAPLHFYLLDDAGRHFHTYTVDAFPALTRIDLGSDEIYPADLKDVLDSWILVYSQVEFDGVSVFGTADGQTQVAMPLFSNPREQMLFPYVYISDFYYTGITLVNQENTEANVFLTAYTEDGAPLGTTSTVIGAMSKYVRLLDEVFAGLEPASIRAIQVAADQPLIGFELFGSYVEPGLAGLPAYALTEETTKVLKAPADGNIPTAKAAPGIPTGLRGWGISSSEIHLSWQPNPEENVEYIIYSGLPLYAEEIARTENLAFTVENLNPDRPYLFFLRSRFTSSSQLSKVSDYQEIHTLPEGESDFGHRVFLNAVPASASFFTGVTFFNLDDAESIITAKLRNSDGSLLAEADWPVESNEQITRRYEDVFGAGQFPDAAYIQLGSGQPIVGFELFLNDGQEPAPFRFDGLPGLFFGVKTAILPYLPMEDEWDSIVSLTNPSGQPIQVFVSWCDQSGEMRETRTVELGPWDQVTLVLENEFPELETGGGWLKLTAVSEFLAHLFSLSNDGSRMVSYMAIE